MKKIQVNERGRRIGQDHHRARLTDSEVEMIRQLHDDGVIYRVLAEKFEHSIWSVRAICRYKRRAQFAVKMKVVF
jgi:hypothetical protein